MRTRAAVGRHSGGSGEDDAEEEVVPEAIAAALRGGAPPDARRCAATAVRQGLTLVHPSAQLEPCLTQVNTLHTLNTP